MNNKRMGDVLNMTVNQVILTEEDKNKFKRDGYWISPKLIDDETIARLRDAIDRVFAGDYDGDGYLPFSQPISLDTSKPLVRVSNGWWVNDEVRAVVTSHTLGEIAAQLIETDEVRLWHDQLIYKQGNENKVSDGNVGWHQDYAYWQCSSTSNMVTAWIALQDTDLTNGGMMTILGSHTWGLIPESTGFRNQNMEELKQKFSSGHEWVEEPCILKAGQASFHHSLTFHGSGPNTTPNPRYSVVAHLMPKEATFRNIQPHGNEAFLGPRPVNGQKFENQFFPLLYRK
ncbi:MAG: phytanoyl-CoA dioxygenase [Paenibacillus sp.]|jgi:ectoine hydroxylase-related dioxygenase (phytanoyl-CoA dioxygenase family)|nr:phytanoyl-CoA dioxygenase [Paenibacillus sp.]